MYKEDHMTHSAVCFVFVDFSLVLFISYLYFCTLPLIEVSELE